MYCVTISKDLKAVINVFINFVDFYYLQMIFIGNIYWDVLLLFMSELSISNKFTIFIVAMPATLKLVGLSINLSRVEKSVRPAQRINTTVFGGPYIYVTPPGG